jgi:hypothetical protein
VVWSTTFPESVVITVSGIEPKVGSELLVLLLETELLVVFVEVALVVFVLFAY